MPLFRRPARRQVTLYGKPGCHLCEEARLVLRDLERRQSLIVQEVDIRSDPELFRRFDIRIPVIDIDGIVELDAPFSRADVVRALRRVKS